MTIAYDNDNAVLECSRLELRTIVKYCMKGKLGLRPCETDSKIINNILGVYQDMTAGRVPDDEIQEVSV